MPERGGLFNGLAAYSRSDDPLTAAANVIALCVAGNQPFYPLYVWWIVGNDGWASCLTLMSTPFFLAVPAIGRRSSLAGRAMLPIVGIANTLIAGIAFGHQSGVALYFGPCAMIAGMALRAKERWVMLAIIGLALAAFLFLSERQTAPLHQFSAEQYARFLSLNAWSVAGLTAFVALQFSSAYAKILSGGAK